MSELDAEEVVLELEGGSLGFGSHALWHDLDLVIRRGEFIAVLGPNGSGKTSLVRVLLGLQALDSGTLRVLGRPARRGNNRVGYVPQLRLKSPGVPLRGRDLVALGADGHRFGPPVTSRSLRNRISAAIDAVDATQFAHRAVGLLSGGEQQRLRVAQALVGGPALLICDEPLLSLDVQHQLAVVELIDRRRREHGTAVVFVTHDLSPVAGIVDRVLDLGGSDVPHPELQR